MINRTASRREDRDRQCHPADTDRIHDLPRKLARALRKVRQHFAGAGTEEEERITGSVPARKEFR
jgi:hypothetical protein